MKVSTIKPDRNNISLLDGAAVKLWVKRLGKPQEEIEAAIEKVGPSCAAVRKELGLGDEANQPSEAVAS